MEEVWKDIKGYENLYMISSYGRVKSLDRYADKINKFGTIYRQLRNEKILRTKKDKKGYLRLSLCKDGKSKTFKVHRLVAEAFIPNPNNYPQVNHKDENPSCNFVHINEDGTVNLEKSNLEWCDQKYNNNYGTRNERIANLNRGKKHSKEWCVKISEAHKGKIISEDTKNKLRVINTGKKLSEETKEKIRQTMLRRYKKV